MFVCSFVSRTALEYDIRRKGVSSRGEIDSLRAVPLQVDVEIWFGAEGEEEKRKSRSGLAKNDGEGRGESWAGRGDDRRRGLHCTRGGKEGADQWRLPKLRTGSTVAGMGGKAPLRQDATEGTTKAAVRSMTRR